MNLSKASRILNILILCCFFLPFFPIGCGPSAEEKKKADEKRKEDSIEAVNRIIDTINTTAIDENTDSAAMNSTAGTMDETTMDHTPPPEAESGFKHSIEIKDGKESIAGLLSERYPFLVPLLTPDGNRTGIGYIIDFGFFYILFFGTVTAFIFLLFNFFIKSVKIFRNIYSSLVLSILSGGSLFYTTDTNVFNGSALWGYWVTIYAISLMAVIDLIIVVKALRSAPSGKDEVM